MENQTAINELVKALEAVTFIAETVAHLKGLERDILPTTDAARLVIAKHKIIKAGDVVKFAKPLDKGDEDLRMVALENEDGGRVLVQALVGMQINPTGRYNTNDLQCES